MEKPVLFETRGRTTAPEGNACVACGCSLVMMSPLRRPRPRTHHQLRPCNTSFGR